MTIPEQDSGGTDVFILLGVRQGVKLLGQMINSKF